MATLVGRECWVGGEKLTHGVVAHESVRWVNIKDLHGNFHSCPKNRLAFDRHSALRICQEAEQYWQLERMKLQKEIAEGKE